MKNTVEETRSHTSGLYVLQKGENGSEVLLTYRNLFEMEKQRPKKQQYGCFVQKVHLFASLFSFSTFSYPVYRGKKTK